MAGHTPAPWKWVIARTMRHLHGQAGHFGVSMPWSKHDDARRWADARLIAAAPEILAALQKIAEDSNDPLAVREARAAIARATPSPTDASESDNG